jgi:plastocyanin
MLRFRTTAFLPTLALTLMIAGPACANPAHPSAGGEPLATNTPTNSFFWDYTASSGGSRYTINVAYNGGPLQNRGTVGPVYGTATPGLSQTETGIANGSSVYASPSEEFWDGSAWIPYPCSGGCSSSTGIDLGKPQATVYAAGTATYTTNPVIPIHIDYSDAMTHPWPGAAGASPGSAVFLCQRRDRACNGSDTFNYTPACSNVNGSRFSTSLGPKQNSFDCTADYSSLPDGLVAACAIVPDGSIPDPDPTAYEAPGHYPTHSDQFKNPATGTGWTADKANLSDISCGSVILDRQPPSVSATPSSSTPSQGDLVTFSASASDGTSGIAGGYSWNFGDNTQTASGDNVTHTYTQTGTYQVTVTTHDGAGNTGTGHVTVTVKSPGSGTISNGGTVTKPVSSNAVNQQAGGGGVQKVSVGGLKILAPKKFRLKKRSRPLVLALTPNQAGAFSVALLKGTKILSKGAGAFAKAGTYGFKLKLPRKMKAGVYKLKVTFIPRGSKTGSTKALKIRFLRPLAHKAVHAVASRSAPQLRLGKAPRYPSHR